LKKDAGMIPTFALPGRQDARAVRADDVGDVADRLQVGEDAQLVVGGDALGDRDDRLDARVGRLEDRVGGEARRDEDHRRVRALLVHGVVERVEHRDALDVLAALARRDAATTSVP
jgi:hypothetical protein